MIVKKNVTSTTSTTSRTTMPAMNGTATRRPVSPGWVPSRDADGQPVWAKTRPALPTGDVWVRTRDGHEPRPHPFRLA